ncbi:MAG: hypothetical protein ACR2KO_00335 [Geodermatophilaceae bacterium]|jgi:hypothetical protein
MTDMHMKGYILQLFAQRGALWDHEVAADVMREYALSGEYWYGTVRLTLTDLFSGGLLDEIETTIDPEKSFGAEKLLFKFGLNDFGRERMRQSGLLTGVAS